MTNTTPETEVSNDPVNHPKHYTDHKSGVECIQITEHMGFNLGNATKYIWRCDLKKDAIEDLKKAMWYIKREIAKREKEAGILDSSKITASTIESGSIIQMKEPSTTTGHDIKLSFAPTEKDFELAAKIALKHGLFGKGAI